MKKALRIAAWIAATAAAAVLGLSCVREDPPAWSLKPGDACPEFSVMLSDGRKITSESLRDRYTWLVFFNTGCPDCREELPAFESLWLASQAPGPAPGVLCISREEGAADVAAYWREEGFTMPWAAEEGREVYSLFASSGIPRGYLVGPELIIEAVR